MMGSGDTIVGHPGGGSDARLPAQAASDRGAGAESIPTLTLNSGFADIVGGLCVGGVGLLFLVYALRLPPSFNTSDVGAGTFPAIASGSTLILALVMALRGAINFRLSEARVQVGQPLRVAGLALLICGYVLLLPMIGLYLSTTAFLVAGIFVAGRIGVVSVAVGIALTLLIVWLLFDLALGVPFPKGIFA